MKYQDILYRTLSEVEPGNAKIHNNIGATLNDLGQSEAALRSFKRAPSLNPTLEGTRSSFEKVRKTFQQSGEKGVRDKRSNPRRDTKDDEGPPRKSLKGLCCSHDVENSEVQRCQS